MSVRVWNRLLAWSAVGGSVILFQGACAIDPDIYLQAFLQILTAVGVFSLENLANAIR